MLPKQPAYECQKCGLVSHHPKDLAHRFCVKCGFEDVRELEAMLREVERRQAERAAGGSVEVP